MGGFQDRFQQPGIAQAHPLIRGYNRQMRYNVEQNHRTDYRRKKTRRHPEQKNGRKPIPARPESELLARLAPIPERKNNYSAPIPVEYRGEFYPANFVFYSPDKKPVEGEEIGEARPVNPTLFYLNGEAKQADPGQLLYWEGGQVVAKSARRPAKPANNGRNHR
jgi:hypothetical protein